MKNSLMYQPLDAPTTLSVNDAIFGGVDVFKNMTDKITGDSKNNDLINSLNFDGAVCR